ncbi:MAG: DUF4363 family protein [Firmicutes bacterium]|nr:DUF4363 family protein [Bacillota bacterium]
MKFYLLVAGLVMSLLLLSVSVLYTFTDDAAQMADSINRLEAQLLNNEWGQAESTAGEISGAWEQHKQWWPVFIDHQEIDNIDMTLARTVKFVENKARAQAIAELAVLKVLLKHVPEKERVNLKNVLLVTPPQLRPSKTTTASDLADAYERTAVVLLLLVRPCVC